MTYDTLAEAVNELTAKGYSHNFSLDANGIVEGSLNICLTPSQFEIKEIHRFEGMTDPGDNTIVYAIEAKDHTIRGLLVNGYGTYADSMSEDMIAKLSIRDFKHRNT